MNTPNPRIPCESSSQWHAVQSTVPRLVSVQWQVPRHPRQNDARLNLLFPTLDKVGVLSRSVIYVLLHFIRTNFESELQRRVNKDHCTTCNIKQICIRVQHVTPGKSNLPAELNRRTRCRLIKLLYLCDCSGDRFVKAIR